MTDRSDRRKATKAARLDAKAERAAHMDGEVSEASAASEPADPKTSKTIARKVSERARARAEARRIRSQKDRQDTPDEEDSEEDGFKSLALNRKKLRSAFSDSDLRGKTMMRALKSAGTAEEALVALAEKAAQQGEQAALSKVSTPTVPPARFKLRHLVTLLSFSLCVIAPTSLTFWYLNTRAAPQYASTMAFSVRQEDHTSPAEALGTAFGIANTQTSDTDVLYDFLTSQELVSSVRAYRDLETIWSRPGSDLQEGDPLFALRTGGTIEDLTNYWNRMVNVAYDTNALILEVRVLAFTPQEAQTLAQDILRESTKTINALSSVARRDVLTYAQEDLIEAENALKAAREALTTFRNRYQIASIDTDISLATGPLNALTNQLVTAKIERGLLTGDVTLSDPRVTRIDARIAVIEEQILQERAKFGGAQIDGNSQEDGDVLASRIATFERLTVDREFAERTYETALGAFYAARAEANRQSLYLAAHKNPSLAERADYPNNAKFIAIVLGLSFALWALSVLTLLSLRDRR